MATTPAEIRKGRIARRLSRALMVAGLPAMLSLSLLSGGCSSGECLDNSNALPYAGFYSNPESRQKLNVEGLSVKALGVPGDSLLLNGRETVSDLYLPFNLDADETTYVFGYPYGDESTPGFLFCDTITFHYTRQPWFVSSACGVVVNFNVDSISTTHLLIDSVACPGRVITNADSENIKIYFKVDPEE